MAAFAWSRRKHESDAAWLAFTCYRDMEPPRSMLGAYRDWLAQKGKEKRDPVSIPDSWNGWRVEWDWEERCLAMDNHLDQRRLNAKEQALEEMAQRHIKIAKLAQTKILQKLRDMDPNEITAASLSALLQTVIRIEREAQGQPGEIIGTGVIEIKSMEAVPPEDNPYDDSGDPDETPA